VTDFTSRELRADCAACCGLCCVSPPFDADQGFGYDKPAHEPCSHLRGDFSCGIHPVRAAQGFAGCSSYDCLGAGQRVTRAFSPDTWQSAPERAAAMHEAFMRTRGLHELLVLLATARRLVRDPGLDGRLLAQQQRVDALCDAIPGGAQRGAERELREQTLQLLRELATAPGIAGRQPLAD
jgi:hypothetical protein